MKDFPKLKCKMEENLQKPTLKKKQSQARTLKILTGDKKPVLVLFLFPTLLLIILTTLVVINNDLKEELNKKTLSQIPFPLSHIASYPKINSLTHSFSDLSCEGAMIMDDNSKVILFAKNENKRLPMASTVKIMTALTALDYFRMDDILEIKTNSVLGAIIGFKKGEKFLFEDLLYAMLLPSGNDAALAIAQNYKEGEDAFIQKMNKNAQKFHLTDTHFTDSTGLDDQGDYTTIKDLARLASISIRNKIFARIVSTKSRIISTVDGKKQYDLHNLNELLGVDGVNGIKTGFTDEAKGILVTSRVENGHTFIIVVMKSQDRFLDTEKLLTLISGKVAYLDFIAPY